MKTDILTIARRHLGKGNESSARHCLADAVKQGDEGNLVSRDMWALRAIAHSVGILHPDYAAAFRAVNGNGPVHLP